VVEISRVEVHYILNAIPYQAVKLVFIVVKIFLKRNKIFISFYPKGVFQSEYRSVREWYHQNGHGFDHQQQHVGIFLISPRLKILGLL
jgi:hypothetical protein